MKILSYLYISKFFLIFIFYGSRQSKLLQIMKVFHAHFVLKSMCTNASQTCMKFEIGNRSISFRETNSFRQTIVSIVH